MNNDWKVGDWVVFDRDIVQIKELRGESVAEVSNGSFSTYGHIVERLRPLTLRNKRLIEYFAHYYDKLDSVAGARGFNFPDISRHFSNLALTAIDGHEDNDTPLNDAREFYQKARNYAPIIQGVSLFRAA